MTEKTSTRRTRKRHRAVFKAKVNVAALRMAKTLNHLSAEHGVHPVVISDWKKQALLALPGVFRCRDSGCSSPLPTRLGLRTRCASLSRTPAFAWPTAAGSAFILQPVSCRPSRGFVLPS